MAVPSEVRQFAVSVPAGTSKTAPQVTELAMPPRIVTEVRVRVPPGPRGEVGWALGAAGVAVLPWNAGAWMVVDDESIDWPLTDQIESGAWQLQAYNTGAFAHTIYVTFLLDQIGQAAAAAVPSAPLPVSVIAAAAPVAVTAPATVPLEVAPTALPFTPLVTVPEMLPAPEAITGGAGFAAPTPAPVKAPPPLLNVPLTTIWNNGGSLLQYRVDQGVWWQVGDGLRTWFNGTVTPFPTSGLPNAWIPGLEAPPGWSAVQTQMRAAMAASS